MTTRKQKIVLYTFDCTGCGYCVKVCGNEVLKLVDNGACRFVNVADASRCNGCGRCERRCPNGAISLKQPDIMKEKLKTAGFCLGGTALLALGVAVTMWLWNALIPEIVGWTSINYWQALGLLLLIRLLFGTSAPSGVRASAHGRAGSTATCTKRCAAWSHSEKREFIRRRMRDLCERGTAADETGKE